jgi:hypothetical protein
MPFITIPAVIKVSVMFYINATVKREGEEMKN